MPYRCNGFSSVTSAGLASCSLRRRQRRQQAEDVAVLVAPEEHPEWALGAQVTDDGHYLLISVGEGCLPVNRCCPLWDAPLSQQLPHVALIQR